MKTQFSKPSNGTTFKALKVGDVFTVAGFSDVRMRIPTTNQGFNGIDVRTGALMSFHSDLWVSAYPNAILVMGEPA